MPLFPGMRGVTPGRVFDQSVGAQLAGAAIAGLRASETSGYASVWQFVTGM